MKLTLIHLYNKNFIILPYKQTLNSLSIFNNTQIYLFKAKYRYQTSNSKIKIVQNIHILFKKKY